MHEPEQSMIALAQEGDAVALNDLLESVRDRVYRLALRMTADTVTAEDASQEILLKVLTRLSTYQGDAAFTTWVHRVAVNHLIDRKRSPAENFGLTFEMYGQDLQSNLAVPEHRSAPEIELLANEVKLGCTQAMLVCLDRNHRVAYVLGEVFDLSSDDAAYVCEVTPATYRKRLSRARTKVRSFLRSNCGLLNSEGTSCRCNLRIEVAVELGRIDPAQPRLTNHPAASDVHKHTAEMRELTDAASLFRDHPQYLAPEPMNDRIRELIGSGRFGILS